MRAPVRTLPRRWVSARAARSGDRSTSRRSAFRRVLAIACDFGAVCAQQRGMTREIVRPMAGLPPLTFDAQRAAHACDEMSVSGRIGGIDLVWPQGQEPRKIATPIVGRGGCSGARARRGHVCGRMFEGHASESGLLKESSNFRTAVCGRGLLTRCELSPPFTRPVLCSPKSSASAL